ncbi:MAG: hypothetical protein EBV84_12675 [Betaproteobacteria bacterium]|nr:hypothetical protein [Betaproteobacteria bacterium]NBY56332.1 hypothetical protein [Betaproteobacteria bacterium]NCW26202.1 hypothetical protein [Betaproteobacteria bacterium]NCW80688.1 hypothetical protein [Betaproteobacteria bacterium]NCY06613.1 hypothetical protein [Betaproteobacteria bacterium]
MHRNSSCLSSIRLRPQSNPCQSRNQDHLVHRRPQMPVDRNNLSAIGTVDPLSKINRRTFAVSRGESASSGRPKLKSMIEWRLWSYRCLGVR